MTALFAMVLLSACKDTEEPYNETGLLEDSTVWTEPAADIVPLYSSATLLEPDLVVEKDGAIVTQFADRGRDRHAREDEFQSYDHYLPLYWEYRTARVRMVDTVASGGGTIDISFVTEWKLTIPEFRAWYMGRGTVANYWGNYANSVVEEGPGTWDDDHNLISEDGHQYRYSLTLDHAMTIDGAVVPLEVGQFMEMEISQFLEGVPSGRANYYGTALLYEVGVGGLVPWKAVGDFSDQSSERENSHKLDEAAWLGGGTTLHMSYSDEPDNHYMQMATNIAAGNGQPFVLGRRVHHTNMIDGTHDESSENGTFTELMGLAGPLYINHSCDSCHTRNGRASVADVGVPLEKWVFKVGDENQRPHPDLGEVLQLSSTSGSGEGSVSLAQWEETEDGLRRPVYAFEGTVPDRFSGRLTPSLVGMGLIEAVDEQDVLDWEDPQDADGDGISGRAQRVLDPETGDVRLGRFGWKAGTSSLRHQVASALNTDMGVMTSVFSTPDCGSAQSDCGNVEGEELSEAHLDNLVRYVALLGVRGRRNLDDPSAQNGEGLFFDLGCESCHRSSYTTSAHHPLSELRSQTISPYSDFLLHDMGEGLADSLGEGEASGAEWRTSPLWGLGLSSCVTGGVEGPNQSQTCVEDASYLHDGRARTLEEAILWHGGEGAEARDAFQALSAEEKSDLVSFLRSL